MGPRKISRPMNALPERILGILAAHSGRVLLRDDAVSLGGDEITKKIAELARVLDEVCGPRARVGVLLPNSAGKAFLVLGLLATERVPVLMSGSEAYESDFEAMRLHALVTDVECVGATVPQLVVDEHGVVRRVLAGQRSDAPLPPDDTALILYTSGSSGEPKGVRITPEAILYTADFLIGYQKLDAESVAAVVLPICHTMGLNTQFLPTFFAGGASVFFDSALSLNRIYRDILDSGGTNLALISHLVRLCADERVRRDLPAADRVRQLTLAGGLIRHEHMEMARALFPRATLYKGYGLTEGVRISMIDSDDPDFAEDNAGYVLPNQRVKILDDRGHELPAGRIGHIFVSGPNVMSGYDNDEAAPIHGGYLDTNDLGLLNAKGQLAIQGRADGVVKIYGKRVSLKRLEDAAVKADASLRDVKCLSIASVTSEPRLALFLEMGRGFDSARSELFASAFERDLAKNLRSARFWPRDVFLLKSFPRTANGKVKLAVLRELWLTRESLVNWTTASEGRSLQFFRGRSLSLPEV